MFCPVLSCHVIVKHHAKLVTLHIVILFMTNHRVSTSSSPVKERQRKRERERERGRERERERVRKRVR